MRKIAMIPVLGLAGLVALSACSDVDYEPPITSPAPPTRSLELTIVSTGQDLDADGYTATLNCGCFMDVQVNEVATMADVEPGSHMVLLTGIAANCDVEGPNPRWVTIEADATAEVTFSVACHGYR